MLLSLEVPQLLSTRAGKVAGPSMHSLQLPWPCLLGVNVLLCTGLGAGPLARPGSTGSFCSARGQEVRFEARHYDNARVPLNVPRRKMPLILLKPRSRRINNSSALDSGSQWKTWPYVSLSTLPRTCSGRGGELSTAW